MRKIIEYKVATRADVQSKYEDVYIEFHEMVNDAISEGWELIGGVSTTEYFCKKENEPVFGFYQAMVKYEESTDD